MQSKRGKLEEKLRSEKDTVHVKLLNVQGLTLPKMYEIEKLIMSDLDIVCLTETQLKIDKVHISDQLKKYISMRKDDDQKGGGLMVLHKNNSDIEINQIQTKNTDIMHLNIKAVNFKIALILVYFSVSNVDKQISVKTEINELLEISKDQPLLMIGDFNGHVGFLGEQTLDRNGQMIIEWLEKENLIMLNDDTKCDGLYTWQRQNQKKCH